MKLLIGRIVLILVAVAALFGFVHHHFQPVPKPNPNPPPASQCDQTLLKHVYHPIRLKVVAQCRTYSGVIEFDRTEPDGDHHILIKPDDPNSINAINTLRQHGDLVVEPVCVGTVTQTDAISSCQGFKSNVTVPPIGTHVTVTGQYVVDLLHGGWTELHPVTTMLVTGKAGAERVQQGLTDWVDEP